MEPTNSKSKSYLLVLLLIVAIIALGFFSYTYKTQIKKYLGFATVTDPFLLRAIEQDWTTTGHAWGENVGWISFQETNSGIVVGDYQLLGYAWGENVGWISLNCLNTDSCGTVDYAVENDGEGHLSGYAWGENIGWIDFYPTNGGVVIDREGLIRGYAWGENVGWINFEETGNVATNWRHQSDRPQCNNGLDDDGDGLIDFPQDFNCYSLSDIKESSNNTRPVGAGGDSVGQEPENYSEVGEDVTNATTSIDVSTSTSPVSTSTPSTGPSGAEPSTQPGSEQGGDSTQIGQPGVQVVFTGRFTRDLTVGSVGDDVVALQMFLNSYGTIVATEGVGSPNNETTFFGNRTRDALKKFQEANAASILTPIGLREGTGYFGGMTRTFINSLIETLGN